MQTVSDVLSWLPAHALLIHTRLHEEDAQRSARARERSARIRDGKSEIGAARLRVAELESFDKRGKLFRETNKRITESGATVTDVEEDPVLKHAIANLERLEGKLAMLESQTETPTMTGGRLDLFLAHVDPEADFIDARLEPKLLKNESREDALARLDESISADRAERKRVVGANLPLADVKAAVKSQIRALAGRGTPKTLATLQGGDVEFPKIRLPGTFGNRYEYAPDGVALVAWLFGDELEKKLGELLEFNCDPADAMSAGERAKRLAALDARLLTTHRERAAVVEAIIEKGGTAVHRPDAPPEAVLGISRA